MKKTCYLFSLILLLTACSSDPLKVDVSDQNVEIPLLRMEQDLDLDVASVEEASSLNDSLLAKYGELHMRFVGDFIQEGSAHDPMAGEYLFRRFQNDELMKEVVPGLKDRFSDFSAYHSEIEEAFKYYKHYFPDSALPDHIITFFSYFNSRAEVADNNLCIALEMHLGSDHPSVQKLPVGGGFPQYFKAKMEDRYLVANAIKCWLLVHHYVQTGDEFLDQIISAGKIMYLMDAMLPEASDGVKMGYSEEEVQWAVDNENAVWMKLIEDELLYQSDALIEVNWIDQGPFTKGLPEDSPAQMGVWMGWQMVRDYMRKNPEVTLDQLIEESNPKRILKHYDPQD